MSGIVDLYENWDPKKMQRIAELEDEGMRLRSRLL